jgi:uncharacterized membrane protein YhiD involved in acid resistance
MEWIVGLCNLGALAVVTIVFIWVVFPRMIQHLNETELRHESRIDALIKSSREERERFYENLKSVNMRLEIIDDKIDAIIGEKNHV